MSNDDLIWQLLRFAAMRRLDLVSAKDVVNWAALRIAQGEAPKKLVDLASEATDVNSPTVDIHLARLLNELGQQEVDDVRAGLIVAYDLVTQIVSELIEPVAGARKIWWDVARKVPVLEPRLRVFIGLVSEWDDDVENRRHYSAEIVAESKLLLQNGKLGSWPG